MKTKPHNSKYESGASIIEFAFVAFLFFLILWGIFEFSRAFYVRNTTQHLTRCIAREAVVFKPSQHAAAKESCLMQMGGSGSNYYWPFYHLTPTDMKAYFRIHYHLLGGGYVPEPTNTSYDNQLELCTTGSGNCVTYVQVYVRPLADLPAALRVREFGILRAWLGIGGSTSEPLSATTMPAESMGYSP